MKLQNIKDINIFIKTVDECEGPIWLISVYGDKYNLKSKLSQYIGIGALLGEHGEELELFCDNKEDEVKFLGMFHNNPNML